MLNRTGQAVNRSVLILLGAFNPWKIYSMRNPLNLYWGKAMPLAFPMKCHARSTSACHEALCYKHFLWLMFEVEPFDFHHHASTHQTPRSKSKPDAWYLIHFACPPRYSIPHCVVLLTKILLTRGSPLAILCDKRCVHFLALFLRPSLCYVTDHVTPA